MSIVEVTINASQGAAVSNEPLVVVVDEAAAINWSAAAATFIDEISGTNVVASVEGVECASWEEGSIVQTAGSRHLTLHAQLPTCADGTVLQLESGAGTTRSASGVPRTGSHIYAPCQTVSPLNNLGSGADLTSSNVSQVAGQIAGAAGYNGTSSQSIGEKPACASGFGISAWLYYAAAPYRTQFYNQWGTGGAGKASWVLQAWDYNLGFVVRDAASGYNVGAIADARDYVGEWIHIAAIYDATNGRTEAWLNGESTGANEGAVCQTSTLYDVTLGRQASGGNFYGGYLDQVVMLVGDWWTEAEVQLHYRNGANDAFWSDPVAVGARYPATLLHQTGRRGGIFIAN